MSMVGPGTSRAAAPSSLKTSLGVTAKSNGVVVAILINSGAVP